MSCNFCTPNGWKNKCCCICGAGSTAYISISIATDNDDQFPYTQTDLCKECFEAYGIETAFNHNEEIRDEIETSDVQTRASS